MKTPVFILEEEKLIKNLEILRALKIKSGVKILLALKAFSMYSVFDLVAEYLDGATASGLNEARLAKEYFGKETHTYSPAFSEQDLRQIANISDHIIFNSVNQLNSFYELARHRSLGLRVNPEVSASPVAMYNPCGLYSRLGVTRANFDEAVLDKIDGLSFHALCEESAEALVPVLESFEAKFGAYLKDLKWVNFGGGHHITRQGYNTDLLASTIADFKRRYAHLEVYLEPGEAVAWQTGVLEASVLDVVDNGMKTAILDTSAEAHMLDTVIMPYTPAVLGAQKPGVLAHTYRLGGNTCLAGDIIGEYSFTKELSIGDRVTFLDMIHYTMVKTTTFNGINLPSIAIKRRSGKVEILKTFGYDEFKARI